MSNDPVGSFLTQIWSKFIALKLWQKILIGFIALSVVSGIAGGSEKSDEAAAPAPEISASATPVATASESASPSASATPSSSTPDSPSYFKSSSLGNLEEMAKDVNDARIGISRDSLTKYYWNIGEVSFNLGQLQSLTPQAPYADKWNAGMAALEKAIDGLSPTDVELTNSVARAALNAVDKKIAVLVKISNSISG